MNHSNKTLGFEIGFYDNKINRCPFY